MFIPSVLGLLVLGVLIEGSVNRNAPSVDPTPPESEPAIQPLVAMRSGLDKAPLEYFSEYWFQLGDDVRRVLVEIGPSHTPGVLVAPGVLISSLYAADEVRNLKASREAWQSLAPKDNDSSEADDEPLAKSPAESVDHVLLVDADLGLALFQAPGLQPAEPLVAADSGLSYPGSLVAAVGLAPSGRLRIAPGHLESSAVATNDTPFAPLEVTINMPFLRGAAAIVDLNSELLGVAVDGPAEPRFVAWPTIQALLDRLDHGEPCRAIEVSDLDAAAAKILNLSNGVLTEKVRTGAYPSAAPVRAGDILLEWAGQPVADAAAFQALYDKAEPGSHVPIVVWRDGRRIRGEAVTPGTDCRPLADPPEMFADLGFTARWMNADEAHDRPAGWQVAAVLPKGRVDGVIQEGDEILSVNGRTLQGPRSARTLTRLESTQSILFGVWRRGRVVMLVLPAAEAATP
ncbi:MAG: hypothetical protein R2748_22585 [Bryobacterales bacterium]